MKRSMLLHDELIIAKIEMKHMMMHDNSVKFSFSVRHLSASSAKEIKKLST